MLAHCDRGLRYARKQGGTILYVKDEVSRLTDHAVFLVCLFSDVQSHFISCLNSSLDIE